jgi:hypothetical protein
MFIGGSEEDRLWEWKSGREGADRVFVQTLWVDRVTCLATLRQLGVSRVLCATHQPPPSAAVKSSTPMSTKIGQKRLARVLGVTMIQAICSHIGSSRVQAPPSMAR